MEGDYVESEPHAGSQLFWGRDEYKISKKENQHNSPKKLFPSPKADSVFSLTQYFKEFFPHLLQGIDIEPCWVQGTVPASRAMATDKTEEVSVLMKLSFQGKKLTRSTNF